MAEKDRIYNVPEKDLIFRETEIRQGLSVDISTFLTGEDLEKATKPTVPIVDPKNVLPKDSPLSKPPKFDAEGLSEQEERERAAVIEEEKGKLLRNIDRYYKFGQTTDKKIKDLQWQDLPQSDINRLKELEIAMQDPKLGYGRLKDVEELLTDRKSLDMEGLRTLQQEYDEIFRHLLKIAEEAVSIQRKLLKNPQ